MRNKMPAFLEKKKRDPKSMNPAKNTKGKAVNKIKSKEEVNADNDRPNDKVEAQPVPNKADAALAQLSTPRNRRKGYQS